MAIRRVDLNAEKRNLSMSSLFGHAFGDKVQYNKAHTCDESTRLKIESNISTIHDQFRCRLLFEF